MINTAEHDKDFLRFLWVDEINSDDPSLVFYRFCRVVFGLCSSLFLLNGTLHYHLRNYFLENPELLKILLKSFHVDDFVSEKDNKPETLDLCLQIRECLAEAGFSLHKWACSDPEIMKLLNEKEVNLCCDNGVSQDDTTFAKLSVGGVPQKWMPKRVERCSG